MKDSNNNRISIPLPTIRRYPDYLRAIRAMIDRGEKRVSSVILSEELGLDPVLTRKDLAMAGVAGRPRLGYPAVELAEAIDRALGWDSMTDAVLIGAGSLGHALLGYKGFLGHGLRIVAAFDNSPNLIGTLVHGIEIQSLDAIPEFVCKLNVKIGILTVPDTAAQSCADILVSAGVKGIWNFATARLEVPKTVKVVNVDLAQSLAVLSHQIVR